MGAQRATRQSEHGGGFIFVRRTGKKKIRRRFNVMGEMRKKTCGEKKSAGRGTGQKYTGGGGEEREVKLKGGFRFEM